MYQTGVRVREGGVRIITMNGIANVRYICTLTVSQATVATLFACVAVSDNAALMNADANR